MRLESKQNMTFFFVPAENFQEHLFFWKDSPDFPDWISQQKFVFHFFKAMFHTSFRPSRPFSGKWNWFVQMVNTIPEWHSRESVTLVITLSFRACKAHTYLATFCVLSFSLLHTNQPTPYVCLRLGRPHFKTYFTATGITVVTQMV